MQRSASGAAEWLKERQRPARPHILRASLAGSLAGVASIIQLGAMAWIVHSVLVTENTADDLIGYLILVVFAIVVRALANTAQSRFSAKASDDIRARLRSDLINHLASVGPVRLSAESAGTLATEWIDQVDALHGYYAHYLPQMILCATVPLMVLATVFWLDWLAAIFLFLSAPLIPLFMALVGMGAEKLNQQHMQTLGRLSGHFLDRIRGLTTLQLFQSTGAATDDISAATDEYRRINLKTLRVAFLSSAVLEFFASVAIAVIAIYIGFGLLGYIQYGPSSELTLFSGLFILLLAPEFFQPLRQLAQHYHDRAKALGAAAQLQERLRGDNSCGNSPKRITMGPATNGLDVRDVSIIYPDGRTGLDGVTLLIPAGELTLLEGSSGSGKSTLLHAMAGFLTPSQGSITIFGNLPGNQKFGWMGQSPFIRQDTWAGNLRLGAPEATDSELIEALKKVGLGDLVSRRPDGLNTLIQEGGAGLSGGQARRLALARLFLARYPLVLMDEPTAGLDAYSEQQVISAIRALREGGVTIVIASHHPALRSIADQRITLASGKLVYD